MFSLLLSTHYISCMLLAPQTFHASSFRVPTMTLPCPPRYAQGGIMIAAHGISTYVTAG